MACPERWGMIPGRVTYVIDKQGIVRHIFASQFQAARHVEEALRVLGRSRARREALRRSGTGRRG